MRKMYIQPETEITQVVSTMVMNGVSTGNGGNTSELGEGKQTGDAPKRRMPAF